jgi:hypothetical protein
VVIPDADTWNEVRLVPSSVPVPIANLVNLPSFSNPSAVLNPPNTAMLAVVVAEALLPVTTKCLPIITESLRAGVVVVVLFCEEEPVRLTLRLPPTNMLLLIVAAPELVALKAIMVPPAVEIIELLMLVFDAAVPDPLTKKVVLDPISAELLIDKLPELRVTFTDMLLLV